jgi:DNA-binding LytR/AlgR family response regulator
MMTNATTLSGLSILVLEDDFYLAEDTREALEEAGGSVVGPFASAGAIEDALEEASPDCALLDVNLGGGPNFGPARMLTARRIPVVLITGYDTAVIPPDLADVPCLQKPANARKIVSMAAQLCGR